MNAGELFGVFYEHPLAALAIGAILAAVLARRLQDSSPALARGLGNAGYVGIAAALMLLIVQTARQTPRSEANLSLGMHPALVVRGAETVVPMASDGHFWVEAAVNGKPGWFLVDTGASLTSLAPGFANEAGVVPDPQELPIELDTANGTITARLGNVSELTIGNIAVSDLEVAISPLADEDTNLLGMNLLSRLASWRVEGENLVLVPKS